MMAEKIKKRLIEALKPEKIDVVDNSAAHAGHAGARAGGGHYHVHIVANCFEGLTLVKRHQIVYQTLSDLMHQQIHALGIDALTPTETKKGKFDNE